MSSVSTTEKIIIGLPQGQRNFLERLCAAAHHQEETGRYGLEVVRVVQPIGTGHNAVQAALALELTRPSFHRTLILLASVEAERRMNLLLQQMIRTNEVYCLLRSGFFSEMPVNKDIDVVVASAETIHDHLKDKKISDDFQTLIIGEHAVTETARLEQVLAALSAKTVISWHASFEASATVKLSGAGAKNR